MNPSLCYHYKPERDVMVERQAVHVEAAQNANKGQLLYYGETEDQEEDDTSDEDESLDGTLAMFD